MPKNSGPTHIRLALWDLCVAEARAAIKQKNQLSNEIRVAQGSMLANATDPNAAAAEVIEMKKKIDELNGYADGMRTIMAEIKQGIRDALDEEEDELS